MDLAVTQIGSFCLKDVAVLFDSYFSSVCIGSAMLTESSTVNAILGRTS